MASGPERVTSGLWEWSGPHPEWHSKEPDAFSAEVISFACRTPEALLLVDPLLPEREADRADALDLIESEAEARIAILITITYHVRSAEQIWERYRSEVNVSIHGHPACSKRLGSAAGALSPIEAGVELPGGAVPYAIGKPRRFETPIHLPSHDALVFGDAVVGVRGGLRMWAMRKPDAAHERFYRDRFAPTLQPLVDLGVERVLVTHGPSVLEGGSEALREAAAAKPWYHRG